MQNSDKLNKKGCRCLLEWLEILRTLKGLDRDSRNPGAHNDFDRCIPSFDKGPRRIEQRFYMYKDCKNKCKLETSRLWGWHIDPFMKSTSKCDSKGCTVLSVLMSRTFGGVHGKTRHFSDRRLFCSIDKE